MSRIRKKSSCYACSNSATTREHIPPKVFFPEKKDFPEGKDYRLNLITVPSCEEHNLEKSFDDEYAFMIIIASFDANSLAQKHFKKVQRSIRKRPIKGKVYLNNYSYITVNGLLSIAPIVDINRLIGFFDLLAKGIYYHHYGAIWRKRISVHPLSFFRPPSHENHKKINAAIIEIRRSIHLLFKNEDVHGVHPEVFYYQIHRNLTVNRLLLRMVFYEGFEIFVQEEINMGNE